MTHDQFAALVARLEEQARRYPTVYRIRVLLLAMFGYGYLGLVVGMLLLLCLLTLASIYFLKALALKLVIPIAALTWMALKALRVKIPPPGGRVLRQNEAPELFRVIDELRRNLRAPRFHRVLISDQFNASVTQVPRLGMLGWHRNYLMIGLPLLKVLTHDQFKAVLAHEFGHLAGGHGRVGNWLYRLRTAWVRLLDALEEHRRFGTFLFRPFFNWYAPYFHAYSFPLARANEYQADVTAAELISSRALAQALTGLDVIACYLNEHFWPQIHQQADDLPQPAFGPYAGMGESLVSGLEEVSVSDCLRQALERETTVGDTHPSLTDRLKAIGEKPRMAAPKAGQAADALLGEALAPVTAEFDRHWHEAILPSWQEHHQEVQDGRQRLKELEEEAATREELPLREAYERAQLTERFGTNPQEALAQFRQLHTREPDHPVICFELGKRLLAKENAAGFNLVESAIAADDDLILQGCEVLRDYCWQNERQDEAHAWNQRLVQRASLLEAARAERDSLQISDKLEPHDLPDDVIAELKQAIRAVRGLKKAYLVRKRVSHLAENRCYVLGFTVSPWWRFHSRRRAADVQRRILETVAFPGETFVINIEGDNYRFGRKLRFRRGARII